MTTAPTTTATGGKISSKIDEKTTKIVTEQKIKKQLRMGPAPFASFEDLSDELESPEDKQAFLIRLPGIHEHVTTPGGTSILESSVRDEDMSQRKISGISLIGAQTSQSFPQENNNTSTNGSKLAPCTPRIDISRASSSSHHEDSKDSTPENQDAIGGALGIGFREEGALELRSSTEELDFQDATDPKPAIKSRPTSPLVFIYDTNFDRQRKDSQTSEICLLSISGRTSRLSSIGSQCSDQSRISTVSHLSVMSGQSGASRSTSPHKMLLETSFCGSKSSINEIAQGAVTEIKDGDELEKVLLARKHDPREAVLAEGITIDTTVTIAPESSKHVKKSNKSPIPKPARTSLTKNKASSLKSQESKDSEINQKTTQITIPTISIADSSQTLQEVNYLTPSGEKLIPGQIIKSQTGVEYTFIPLKGPLPKDFNKPSSAPTQRRRSREPSTTLSSKSAQLKSTTKPISKPIHRLEQKSQKDPEYIRIKLKPDYMYNDDEAKQSTPEVVSEKPTTLDLSYREQPITTNTSVNLPPKAAIYGVSPSYTARTSPLAQEQSPVIHSNASPSLSRRSSLLKSRETISPECATPTSNSQKRKSLFTTKLKDSSDTIKDKRRTRSKSREREWSPAMSSNESIDGKMHKQKTSVFSIFKPKKTPTKSKPSSTKSSAENLQYDGITNVEFTFDKPRSKYHEQLLEGDSIRIPLHSPSEYENRTVIKESDPMLEKEISAIIIENNVNKVEKQISEEISEPKSSERILKHHTSTSSENIVFSTKLGSNEEIFTTKLPKKPTVIEKESVMALITDEKATSSPKLKDISDKLVESQPLTLPSKKSSLEEIKTTPSTEKKIITKKIEIVTETKITTENISSINILPKTEEQIVTEKSTIEVKPSPKKEVEKQLNVSDISNRNSAISTTANEETSENSENDSEIEFINKKTAGLKVEKKKEEPDDHERKTLVFQTDSFEDELPYVPTTLPLERSVAVPIVPIKQRSTFEMKTRPIERPRSTTPINPSCIDDYCGDATMKRKKNAEKLKISLPREDTIEKMQKLKSPRKGTNPKAWQEFAEKGISGHQSTPSSGGSHHAPDSGDEIPPPLPPRGAPKEQIKQWINFEEIPEKHKPPKRIQTIPSRSHIEVPESVLSSTTASSADASTTEAVVYNYVNPEDCQCECHETSALKTPTTTTVPLEEIEPLLQDDDSSDDTMKQSSSSSSQKTKR